MNIEFGIQDRYRPRISRFYIVDIINACIPVFVTRNRTHALVQTGGKEK